MSDEGPLWAKPGLSLDEEIVRFCARDDRELDRELFGADLEATKAHVRGLYRIGALREDEAERLVVALDELFMEHAEGRFFPPDADEDGHSAIERALTERLGELGKKVHLGRSRNDQVLVAERL